MGRGGASLCRTSPATRSYRGRNPTQFGRRSK